MGFLDDPAFKEYFDHADKEMIPKMRDSALCVSITNPKPDAKLCCEVGAAVLYDKPLILLVPEEMQVSANLKRVASALIFGHPSDPKVQAHLTAAIKAVMKNDKRAK